MRTGDGAPRSPQTARPSCRRFGDAPLAPQGSWSGRRARCVRQTGAAGHRGDAALPAAAPTPRTPCRLPPTGACVIGRARPAHHHTAPGPARLPHSPARPSPADRRGATRRVTTQGCRRPYPRRRPPLPPGARARPAGTGWACGPGTMAIPQRDIAQHRRPLCPAPPRAFPAEKLEATSASSGAESPWTPDVHRRPPPQSSVQPTHPASSPLREHGNYFL